MCTRPSALFAAARIEATTSRPASTAPTAAALFLCFEPHHAIQSHPKAPHKAKWGVPTRLHVDRSIDRERARGGGRSTRHCRSLTRRLDLERVWISASVLPAESECACMRPPKRHGWPTQVLGVVPHLIHVALDSLDPSHTPTTNTQVACCGLWGAASWVGRINRARHLARPIIVHLSKSSVPASTPPTHPSHSTDKTNAPPPRSLVAAAAGGSRRGRRAPPPAIAGLLPRPRRRGPQCLCLRRAPFPFFLLQSVVDNTESVVVVGSKRQRATPAGTAAAVRALDAAIDADGRARRRGADSPAAPLRPLDAEG